MEVVVVIYQITQVYWWIFIKWGKRYALSSWLDLRWCLSYLCWGLFVTRRLLAHCALLTIARWHLCRLFDTLCAFWWSDWFYAPLYFVSILNFHSPLVIVLLSYIVVVLMKKLKFVTGCLLFTQNGGRLFGVILANRQLLFSHLWLGIGLIKICYD